MMHMRGLDRVLVIGLFLSLLLLPFPVKGAEPYNLGVVLEFTGTGALYSRHSYQGIELAVEEINKEGGFLGKHPIKLFSRDSQSKPDVGVREAKDLILREKVKGIIGTQSSNIALAVEEVCYEYKIIHVIANSNAEAMTVSNYSPYTYQIVPNTYMQATATAVSIAKNVKSKGWKTYDTIGSNYEYPHSTINTVVEHLKKTSPEFKLAKQYWPKLGETEFSAYVTSIIGDKPDFVYACVPGSDGFALFRQGNSYGLFKNVFYASGATFLTEMMEMKDELPRGIVTVLRAPFFANMNNPMMANLVKKYQAKFNQYPDDFVPMQYDAVYVLKQAIEKAGSIEPENVKNAMKGMTVNTTRGSLSFRKIDNMVNCPSYTGIIADDPKYPFPILRDMVVVSGEESWRPESEVLQLRDKADLSKKRRPEELKF